MSDFDKHSRVNNFEKRRKNTKSLSIFIVFGIVLLVVLIGLIVFDGNDEADNAVDNQSNETADQANQHNKNEDGQATNDQDDSKENTTSEESTDPNTDDEGDVKTEQVEPSDNNVVKAYTGDWDPIGTTQDGPHTINLNEGSQDRIEMKKAAASATGLNETSLIMWWINQVGEQKVITTVSDKDNNEVYRAYLTWVDGEGWKPTKVEKLKENDKSDRF